MQSNVKNRIERTYHVTRYLAPLFINQAHTSKIPGLAPIGPFLVEYIIKRNNGPDNLKHHG
jgi:hypothetical protein